MENGSRVCMGLCGVHVIAVKSCAIRPVIESPPFSYPTHRKGPFISCVTLGEPVNPSEPLFAHLGNENDKTALQINTLMLQTGTHPAKGWTHPGLCPGDVFRGSRVSVGEGLTSQAQLASGLGPAWLQPPVLRA